MAITIAIKDHSVYKNYTTKMAISIKNTHIKWDKIMLKIKIKKSSAPQSCSGLVLPKNVIKINQLALKLHVYI